MKAHLECGLATDIGIPSVGELFSPEDIQNFTLSWNENEDTGNMKDINESIKNKKS